MRKFKTSLKTGKRWRVGTDKNLRGLTGDRKVEIKNADGTFLRDMNFKVE